MSRIALLDVNVLIALFDPDHVHHEPAHLWFAGQRAAGWATCPLTENGLIRLLSHPAYTPYIEPPPLLLERLRAFCRTSGHSFWPADASLRDGDLFAPGSPLSHRQVTDLYLLGLAVKHDGCLATFDRSIPLAQIRGAEVRHLAVLDA